MAEGSRGLEDPLTIPGDASGEQDAGIEVLPTSGEGPGILVLDAGGGLTDTIRSLCERLGREGFVAYAPDLHGGQVAQDESQVDAIARGSDFDQLVASVIRAAERLSTHPAVPAARIGTLGIGPGGATALLLAELKPTRVAAVATFYRIEPDLHYEATRAAYLGHFAEHDAQCPWELVKIHQQRIESAGRDVVFYLYDGTRAGFFEPDRPAAYDAAASELAWARTIEFFRDRLSRP